MYELLASENPVTVRQVFYRLVSRGIVARTESEYRSTVARLLAAMRREGAIPYRWIADNTRWMRKSQSYACLEDGAVPAIPPDLLRALVTQAILRHVDDDALDVLRAAETSERELLYAIAASGGSRRSA
jgi:hypothetical protein